MNSGIFFDSGRVCKSIVSRTGIGFSFKEIGEVKRVATRFRPTGYSTSTMFVIEVLVDSNYQRIKFIPGSFSASLLSTMRASNNSRKKLFLEILATCEREGNVVQTSTGGDVVNYKDERFWTKDWGDFQLFFQTTHDYCDSVDPVDLTDYVSFWVNRFVAAVFSIMPIKRESFEVEEATYEILPEGELIQVMLNKYERDPRNRDAAIAIHGLACKACGVELTDIYGELAQEFIEIHHCKPLSELGGEYLVDPSNDLVPLCPNCHSMIHRRIPALSLDELIIIITSRNKLRNDVQ
ncbi:MAG: 5-methylcytosine-specific restriction protein A [Psychroserpens sp.]|jgi:5-methylcytosine-specific restriction protein A